MYEKTKDKSIEIERLYKEGKMLTEICSLTSSSQPTVKRVLLSLGIDYDAERKQDREITLDKVIKLYQEGKAQLFIEKELNLTRKTIRELLKSIGVEYRSKSDQHHIRYNTEIDHNAFDKLTPDALYWIGMLYTDGHVETKKESSLELTLHKNDITHLEKFKLFLKSNRKISKGNGDCLRVRVNSKQLVNKLVDLGFTSNKSITIFPHDLLKESKDFWRGCIDGDGGVYSKVHNKLYEQLFFCGTLETIFEFIIFCVKYTDIKDRKYPTICNGKNLYEVSYYGQDAKKICDLLYKDSTVYLNRKYEMYKQFQQ